MWGRRAVIILDASRRERRRRIENWLNDRLDGRLNDRLDGGLRDRIYPRRRDGGRVLHNKRGRVGRRLDCGHGVQCLRIGCVLSADEQLFFVREFRNGLSALRRELDCQRLCLSREFKLADFVVLIR